MWAILPIRERRCQDIDQVSPTSWDHFFCLSVFSSSEVLGPFGVNCRLQLAGLGKKREKTVKPTCFSLLYVESDFGTTDKSFTVFFARWGVKFDRQLKSQLVELDNSTIELHVPSRQKKSLQSYCSVDFDFLAFVMRFDMTFDVTLRDDSSCGKLTKTSHFHFYW